MHFIRVEGTTDLEHALFEALQKELAQNKHVLWLVPGGSNIQVAVRVMARLEKTNLPKLTIALTDERYGNEGHENSNYYQLTRAGFAAQGAEFTDLLQGDSLDDTVRRGEMTTKNLFSRAEIVIALFGIGADGHIAGILPHSPAVVHEERWMVAYDAGQYTRLTLTPFAFSHVHKAFVGAFGQEKQTVVKQLHDSSRPVIDQPARLLEHIPEVYIYNNYIGD